MGSVVPAHGGFPSASNYIGSMLWANKPSSAQTGSIAFFTDVGAGGSYWFKDSTRWRVIGSNVLLSELLTPAQSASQASERLHYGTVGKIMQNGDVLRLKFGVIKSSNSSSTTIRIYLGTNGTSADTEVFTVANPATTNVAAGFMVDITRIDATTVRLNGLQSASALAQSTTAYASDITVPNLTSNSILFSLYSSNSGVETTTLKVLRAELLT